MALLNQKKNYLDFKLLISVFCFIVIFISLFLFYKVKQSDEENDMNCIFVYKLINNIDKVIVDFSQNCEKSAYSLSKTDISKKINSLFVDNRESNSHEDVEFLTAYVKNLLANHPFSKHSVLIAVVLCIELSKNDLPVPQFVCDCLNLNPSDHILDVFLGKSEYKLDALALIVNKLYLNYEKTYSKFDFYQPMFLYLENSVNGHVVSNIPSGNVCCNT